MNCPPLNGLLDYSQRVLPQSERTGIEAHLVSGCRLCAENLHWLSEVAWLTAQDRSFDLPEETLKGLTVWFQEQTVRPPQTLRRLVARLVFDSLLPQQLAPVRSEPHHSGVGPLAAGRQMLFQADGYDVDLRFEATEDLATEDLLGQILPQGTAQPDIAGARVALWQAEQELRQAQTDQRGLFRFAQIPSGIYELKIQVSEDEIHLNHVPTARAV